MTVNEQKRFVMRYRVVNDAGEETDLKFVYDYSKSVYFILMPRLMFLWKLVLCNY
jgi:hypothetical protein